jgi:hypothetical protein
MKQHEDARYSGEMINWGRQKFFGAVAQCRGPL